jgi:two-component system, sensor histidine kinase PdtaS
MVVSLLNAQTEFLTHPSAIDAIKESRERMQAIAIIHQKLYQIDNTTEVNMRSYINELIDNIKHSFADSDRIYFKLDVDDVGLDISQSVPLGLILNEAITNAIKYAYPKNQKGTIQIYLKHYDTDKLQLKVADSGKGLPDNIDIKHSNSLGMQLIALFSEQLEGDLYFINNNGLEITLNFKAAGYHDAAMNKIIA